MKKRWGVPVDRKNSMRAWILSALIAFGLVCGVPAGADRDADTDYIVKFKTGSGFSPEDGALPFDVVTEEEMERLRGLGLLEWYEPDAAAVLMESAFYDSEQWNLDAINAQGAFDTGALGQGVRVGVVDSGVNPCACFGQRLLPGHNYVEDAPDETDTSDRMGHGTAVAGLIAGADGDTCIGVAPEAEIVPLKITDSGSVLLSAVCRAIYGAIDDYQCNVLNMSFGTLEESNSLREAIDYAAEKGVVVVSSVGNDGKETLYYPAGYDSVIGVGAVNRDGSLYYHSNCNDSVFLSAPGAGVRSINVIGDFTLKSGTSFATPQVVGAAAVLLGIDPTLTPAEIMELMANTASDRGAEGYDNEYGYGVLDLGACIEALAARAAGASEEPAQEPPSPPEDGPAPASSDIAGDDACPLRAFTDLDPTAWYHDGVHFCLENGLMNGVGDGRFDPAGTTSRAMIVTILYRMEGEPEVAAENPFTDVADGQWYTKAVVWAAENGLAAGYGDGSFVPDGSITREQFAAILYRYALYRGLDDAGELTDLPDYPDAAEISGWADAAMRWCVSNALIRGRDGILAPGGDASRAEAATMLTRYCRLPAAAQE